MCRAPRERSVVPSVVAVLITILLAGSCSQETDRTGPETGPAALTGTVDFPSAAVSPAEISIGFGEHESAPTAAGAFSIQGNPGLPGLALATGEDAAPMLMAVVADPRDGVNVAMDARSTALALAFLNPFVCTSDSDDAGEVLGVLGALTELEELVTLLEAKLAANPLALAEEDADVDSALTRVVDAYVRAYPEIVARAYPGAVEVLAASDDAPQIAIDPGSVVSGHQVTALGGDSFRISNARGRWAYCLTPQGDFYLFPNGSLLDALRGRLWAPSQRDFTLDLEAVETDTARVYVYGLGWSDESDNVYDDLSNLESDYVISAGGATVLFEFVPQVISVLTNSAKTFLSAEIADKQIKQLLDFLKYGQIGDRIREYLRAGDYCGLVWYVCKETVARVVHNNDFRQAYLETIGLSLTERAFQRLATWAILPARVVLISDSMTSALKTMYGFASTRFRTDFSIYAVQEEELAVGNVQGSVHDADTGLPIEGATVELLGDEGNPLSPAHQVVTGSSGGYYFSGILVGAKTVRAGKSGYAGASITVIIVEDQTVTGGLIELERTSGSASGLILDEILQHHGAPDPRFAKEAILVATEIGGDHRRYSYRIGDGDYHIGLTAGTWRLAATHDDYQADSVQVTIASDQSVPAPRDLVLRPKGTMEGRLYIDLNADGTYELQDEFSAGSSGAAWFQPDGSCPAGLPRQLIRVQGASGSAEDMVFIYLDPQLLTDAGDYALGGLDVAGCSGYDPRTAAALVTRRAACHDPNTGYEGDMVFTIQGTSAFAPCNCGLADYGSLTLEAYGSQLTDAIDGLLVAYLSGSSTCSCYCCDDVDHDGEADDWVMACAQAKVEVRFRVLVGSLYGDAASPPRVAAR